MAERDEDFAALFEQSMVGRDRQSGRSIEHGQRVKGRVVAAGKEWVFVDIGHKSEARIARSELTDDKGELRVQAGDEVSATVSRPDDPEGPILVATFGREALRAADLELAARGGVPVEGRVLGAVKAGVEVDVGGLRAFCPASQLDLVYVAELDRFTGERHFFKVLEVRDAGRSIVLSRKAVLEEERDRRADEVAARLEVGAEVDGIVQAIKPYGAFIDLGGVQGLAHVSELAHGRVARPEDLLAVGDPVRVKVLSVDRPPSGHARDLKISLSLKALSQPSPQPEASADEILTATINKIQASGLLVDTAAGSGLIPTRELGLPPGGDPRRTFQQGQQVDVVLVGRDAHGRPRFSIAGVAEAEARRNFRDFRQGAKQQRGALGSLGDLLKDVDLGKGARRS